MNKTTPHNPWYRWSLTVAIVALVACSCGQTPIEIEVAVFRGGYGIDFYEDAALEFEKLHPDVKVKVWGNPRVWEQLVPRFAAKDPPDLCYPGFGMNVFSLIFDDQLTPLDKYLAQPAIGVNKQWRDTFLPNMLGKGVYKSQSYTLPYNFDTFGWWYNKKMFREHGWERPRNYDELLALCDRIKKETRIAPITFTGRYSQYMLDGFFLPWAYRAGGPELFKRADRLEPGAWKDPAFLKAAQTIMELKRQDYFQRGAIGMSHTESQMEFLVGRAAMIPNGTWLYSEMKHLLPKDFEMEFMVCPPYTTGVGDASAVQASYDGKGWCIPTKAKHPDQAAEFLRYLTAPASAQRFMERKGTLMAITDLNETNVPPHLREAMRSVREARTNWTIYYAQWYPQFGIFLQNGIKKLYNEVLTPEQFLDHIEAEVTRMRKDPQLRKFSGQ